MSVFILILGIVFLMIVVSDVLVTTLTVKGGGFLTNRFFSWLWHLAILQYRKNPNHRLLSSLGLIMLSGMVVLWYLSTWISWSLIFSAFDHAIVNTSNQEPASIWGRIYYTAYTITTLGRGDYQPQNKIWHLLTGLAAANGFFLVTLSIAYLFPVISAVTQKRVLSVYIASLGGTADEILTRAWNGKNFGNLDQHLINLTPMVIELGEKHLSYPVLHYFHSNERSRALPLSMVALDEALTLLRYAIPENYRLDSASLGTLRRANAAFLQTLKSVYFQPSKCQPPLPSLELLRIQEIPTVSDRDFLNATERVDTRRKLLLAWLKNDGWKWENIESSKTTNRANNLDDETPIGEFKLY